MAKKKTPSKEDIQAIIETRRKAHFAPDFKERSLYSLSNAIFLLEDISDFLKDEDEAINGFNLMGACSSLSHAFEMLFKAIIKRKSPFLLLKKLDAFDDERFDLDMAYEKLSSDFYASPFCSGAVAFSRGVKLLKRGNKLTKENLIAIEKIISYRNTFEHRDSVYIDNYDVFLESLHEGVSTFKTIYTKEFISKGKSFFKEAEKISNIGTLSKTYKALDNHYSSRMKNIFKNKEKHIADGAIFSRCYNCGYKLMMQKMEESTYRECLWCKKVEFRIKCHELDCDNELWCRDGVEPKCSEHSMYGLYKDSSITKAMNAEEYLKTMNKILRRMTRDNDED